MSNLQCCRGAQTATCLKLLLIALLSLHWLLSHVEHQQPAMAGIQLLQFTLSCVAAQHEATSSTCYVAFFHGFSIRDISH